MKIGVLTLPFNNNYGGYLQCFALMKVLKEQGHQVTLINRRPAVRVRLRGFVKGFVKNRLLGDKTRVYNVSSFEARYKAEGAKMLPFVEKHISPKTPAIYSARGYRHLQEYAFDAIVVGSDQVWRPKYVPNVREFFLEGIPDHIRRVAYAASFGTDELEYDSELLQVCKQELSRFKTVSVRESSGARLLEEFFGYDGASVVLDPTMLLDQQSYKNVFNLHEQNCNNVFAYILDRTTDALSVLNTCREQMDDAPVVDFLLKRGGEPLPSIEQWIEGIYNARLVVTDSFHGTVFAILLNRPFYTIINRRRGGSRMSDLLSLLELEDRLVSSVVDLNKAKPEIDWHKVNAILSRERYKSIEFLKQSLQ